MKENFTYDENTIFIVLDLECNFSKDEKIIPRHEREIIEIGAVAVDSKFKILDEISIFVKPEKHRKLTQDCIDFCHISQEDVENAEVFEKSLYKFEDWFLKFSNRVFCSWGDFDKFKMQSECSRRGLKTPIENHINLKEAFAQKQGLKRGVGVNKALNACGIRFAGVAHRGVDDARNIARLMNYSLGDNEARYKHTLYNKKKFNQKNTKNVKISKKRTFNKE